MSTHRYPCLSVAPVLMESALADHIHRCKYDRDPGADRLGAEHACDSCHLTWTCLPPPTCPPEPLDPTWVITGQPQGPKWSWVAVFFAAGLGLAIAAAIIWEVASR